MTDKNPGETPIEIEIENGEEEAANAEMEAFLQELDNEIATVFDIFHRGLLPERMTKTLSSLIAKKNNFESDEDRMASEFALMAYTTSIYPKIREIAKREMAKRTRNAEM